MKTPHHIPFGTAHQPRSNVGVCAAGDSS